MNAPAKLSTIDKLRARDGERCWLCAGKLDFAAVPNSKKAPSVEHLVAKANGGTDTLANLALTHPGCNRQLGCRPLEEKERMRAKIRANRDRVQAVGRVVAETPVEEGGTKGKREPAHRRPVERANSRRMRVALRRWQAAAAAAAGAALLASGFAAGMLVRG